MCVSVIGSFLPHSSVIKRSWGLWRITTRLTSHVNLVYESMEFITLILCSSSGHSDTSEVVAFIHQIMHSQNHAAFNGRLMFGVVKVIDALIMSDPDGAYKGGVYKVLFGLINRAVASLTNSCQPGFYGLEAKSDPSNEDSLNRNVVDAAEASLKRLAHHFCKGDPDTRAVPWFLFCRALCVSTRSVDDQPSGVSITDDEGQTVSLKQNEGSTGITSFRDYVAWCTRSAAKKALELGVVRTSVKSVALASAAEGLKEIIRGSSLHADIERARQATNMVLVDLNGENFETILFAMPCFASLFIDDIIGACCSCATYTVDGVEMRRMQREALQCLATVIYLFSETVDPQSSVRDLALKQYMSQMMSAIRPCLSIRYNCQLLSAAGSLVCALTQFKLLDDKVLLKRVAKPLFPAIRDSRPLDPDEQESATIAAADVSEEFLVTDLIAELGLAARLYSLSHTEGNLAPSEEIKHTILAIFDRGIERLWSRWHELLTCSLLVVHGSKAGVSLELYQFSILLNVGLTKSVKASLIHALPYTIVACICSKKVSSENLPVVLSALTTTVTDSGLSRVITPGELNTLKFTSLLGLIHILKYRDIKSRIREDMWVSILRRLLNTLRVNNFSNNEKLNYSGMLLKLADGLLAKTDDDQSWPKLKSWIWLLHLNVLNVLLPGLVNSDEMSEDLGMLINCFPRIDRYAICTSMLDQHQRSIVLNEVIMTLLNGMMSASTKVDDWREFYIALALPIMYFVARNSVERSARLFELMFQFVEFAVQANEPILIASLRDVLLVDLVAWSEFSSKLQIEFPVGCLPYVIVELWYTIENKV